jgi:hypothetical protein
MDKHKLMELTPDLRARYEEAKKMDVVEAINTGDLDNVKRADVQKLFKILDTNDDALLDFFEIRMFLEHVMDPPIPAPAIEEIHALAQDSIADGIGADLFHSAITTGPLRRLVRVHSRQETVKQNLRKKKDADTEITKEFMLDKFEWRVNRDESFATLPFSLFYLVVFIAVVICHLRIWERQRVERAMEDHIIGWGYNYVGPYLKEHLPNLDQYWAWLETSGMQFAYYYCDETADKSVPAQFCEISPRNMLIADVKLLQKTTEGDELGFWILHSDVAQSFLNDTINVNKNDRLYQAALKQIEQTRKEKWFDIGTETLEMHFSAYDEEAKFFSLTEVRVRFDEYGFATHTVYCWSVFAEAYPHIIVYIVDGLYLLLLLHPTYHELLEIYYVIRSQGMQGFKDYWGLWNIVDWQMILNGIAVIVVWVMIMNSIEVDALKTLTNDKGKLKLSTVSLSASALEEIIDSLRNSILLLRIMHILMAANTVAIMMKFFKAFEANARLQAVTETLTRAGVDIFHFMVVFVAVFNGFVVVGHILLGGDIVHFNSFGASFNTAFLALMGDFQWYSDLTEVVEPLASGLPYTIVALWFWSFMIFCLLILLNMLLAIIMDHYAQVTESLKEKDLRNDAPSLILQAKRYIERKRMYRRGKWIPLSRVLVALQDEKKNLHPDDVVTVQSLRSAFPNMKEEQATYLHNELKKEKRKEEPPEEEELSVRIKDTQAFMHTIAQNLHNISMSVLRCDTKLMQLDLEKSVSGPTPNGQRQSSNEQQKELFNDGSVKTIASQLDAQQRVMKELCEQLAKQQLSSENMAKALGEVAQLVPARDPIPVHRDVHQRQPMVIQKTKPTTLPPCCLAQEGAFRTPRT